MANKGYRINELPEQAILSGDEYFPVDTSVGTKKVKADVLKSGLSDEISIITGEHNTDADAHADIRLFLQSLKNQVDALLDSDDTTLDELSEIVAYIKDNRELIEQVTDAKVSVTDIINNLVTNISNKPLSASQGVALKGMIDALQATANSLTTALNGKESSGAAAQALTDAKEYTDAIKIGGRNLIKGTGVVMTDIPYPSVDYTGVVTSRTTVNATDTEYILSFEAKSTAANDKLHTYFFGSGTTTNAQTSQGQQSNRDDGQVYFTLSNVWERYWVKYKQTRTENTKTVQIRTQASYGTGLVSVRNAKFEVGNKPTDWSPAPEDVQAQIDEIEIGGKNLLTGTKDFSGKWINAEHWTDGGTFNGLQVKTRTGKWQGLSQTYNIQSGQLYTFSLYAKSNGYNTAAFYSVQSLDDDNSASLDKNSKAISISQNWSRHSITVLCTRSGTVNFRLEMSEDDSELSVCGYKLEQGNKATDWSLAPEDVQAEIDGGFSGVGNLISHNPSWWINKSYSSASNTYQNDPYIIMSKEKFSIEPSTKYTLESFKEGKVYLTFFNSSDGYISSESLIKDIDGFAKTVVTPANATKCLIELTIDGMTISTSPKDLIKRYQVRLMKKWYLDEEDKQDILNNLINAIPNADTQEY